jgi:hypothetical protein
MLPCGYSLEARGLYGPVPAREDAPALSTLAASGRLFFSVAVLKGVGSRPRCSDRQRAKLSQGLTICACGRGIGYVDAHPAPLD